MRQLLLIWLILFAFITVATGIVVLITDHMPNKLPGIVWSLLFGALGASVLVGLFAFIRWIGCWRNLRYALVGLAILATLIAIFYTEEGWRGKRAWENSRREAEADGMVLDWNKYIPAPVPDDQNFFTTSSNFLKFRQLSGDNTNAIEFVRQSQWLKLDPFETDNHTRLRFPVFDTSNGVPLVVAKIFFISPTVALPKFDANTYKLALKDPDLSKKLENIFQKTIGETIDGAQGFEFSQFQLKNVNPVQIVISADSPPSIQDIENLLPSGIVKKFARMQVVATASPWNFNVQLLGIRITTATDYLNWSDQFVPAFDDVREALKRPYAIIPGDYSESYSMPIPNFVMMRSLAQTLAQRAQCYLLLGEPDKALHELTLIHDICRILEKPPTGQPETLVEAMINVAITGLYTAIISEGLQRHAWQEPQLIALQQQLRSITLPVYVARSLEAEPAGSTHTLETTPSWKMGDWFSIEAGTIKKKNFWQTITDDRWRLHLEMCLMPRGWVYQNMAVIASFRWSEGFDPENQTILPSKIDESARTLKKTTTHPATAYNFMAHIALPNFVRAWQITAYTQTLANETQITCALERCRLVHGEYPDSLNALVPKYIETLPHDIIGGQPLHYRRTADGKFLLYSVGWNEKDDGGKQSPKGKNNWNIDFSRGDWVWPGTEN